MWEKIKELLNVTKVITCDVNTTQCENDIIKCKKKKGNDQMWQKYSHM